MENEEKSSNILNILMIAVVVVAILTWAVSVFFEIALAKALAGVILGVFIVIVVLICSGLGF